MDNLFETACRKKYRFPYNGMISTEDLWDLSLEQLDSIFKTLNKKIKVQGEDSLMAAAKGDSTLTNMVEIVRYIFKVKTLEAQARRTAVENAEKRRRILEVLEQKQDENLRNMTEEELLKMLDSMK